MCERGREGVAAQMTGVSSVPASVREGIDACAARRLLGTRMAFNAKRATGSTSVRLPIRRATAKATEPQSLAIVWELASCSRRLAIRAENCRLNPGDRLPRPLLGARETRAISGLGKSRRFARIFWFDSSRAKTYSKFVSYLRVSTNRQGKSGLGLAAQREAIADYLNGGSWHLVDEFVEVESGRSSDRPKLAEALALCRAHRAASVVANVSRLTRSVAFLSGRWRRLGCNDRGARRIAARLAPALRVRSAGFWRVFTDQGADETCVGSINPALQTK